MIKTKYVVGDVVVVGGKQLVVRGVEAYQASLYGAPGVMYLLSDGSWYSEDEETI